MADLTLFVAPNTCARVPMVALEEAVASFETELVRVAANQQNLPMFPKLNPKGKVPLLLVDGAPLTENVAILSLLAAGFPDAKLLPAAPTRLEALRQIADF